MPASRFERDAIDFDDRRENAGIGPPDEGFGRREIRRRRGRRRKPLERLSNAKKKGLL